MKKIICILLLIMLSTNAYATGMPEGFISTKEYNMMFNLACIETGSNHIITSENIEIQGGEWRDCFRINLLDNCLEMRLYIPHKENCVGNTPDINEIGLSFASDGTTESVAHLILAIGEIAYATGGINSFDELNGFISELGVLDNVEDGASNSVVYNGIEYSYSLSSLLGFHFSALKAA